MYRTVFGPTFLVRILAEEQLIRQKPFSLVNTVYSPLLLSLSNFYCASLPALLSPQNREAGGIPCSRIMRPFLVGVLPSKLMSLLFPMN